MSATDDLRADLAADLAKNEARRHRLRRELADLDALIAAEESQLAVWDGLAAPGYPLPERRTPYVGQGAEGCRRSARIDDEEADTLPDGERKDEVILSAERWRRQAEWEDRLSEGSRG